MSQELDSLSQLPESGADESSRSDKQRERILSSAIKLFIEHGFKKLTVDEIASAIGISKRTLYKYYPSKEELLVATMKYRQKAIFNLIHPVIHDDKLNSIEKIKQMGEIIAHELAEAPVKLMMDMEMAMPDICRNFKAMRRKNMLAEFNYFYEEGVRTGFFREDIKREFVIEMYYQSMENMLHSDVQKTLKMHPTEIYKCMVNVLFQGLMTEKGREVSNG